MYVCWLFGWLFGFYGISTLEGQILSIYTCIFCGGACGVMVIVVGNGHGDTSSSPGRD